MGRDDHAGNIRSVERAAKMPGKLLLRAGKKVGFRLFHDEDAGKGMRV